MGCQSSAFLLPDGSDIPSNLVQHHFVKDINEIFEVRKSLGKGAFGYVTLALNKRTGKVWAMKLVDLHNEMDKEALRNEIRMLKHLQHPHIVRVYSSYEDKHRMYMIMQLCEGRDLYYHLYTKHKTYTEMEVKNLIRSLLLAVAYLHAHQITHRDIKLENLLLGDESNDSRLMLCDFGFSNFCKKGEKMRKSLGTIDYVAPEVLLGDYNEKCDLWSVGVICYELLCRKSPFRAETRDATIGNILDANLSFSDREWLGISPDCISFIQCLVKEDVDKRWSAQKALRHPWIRAFTPEDEKIVDPQKRELLLNVVEFGKCKKMKQTALLSIALGIQEFHNRPHAAQKVFDAIDKNGVGEISLREFIEEMKSVGLDEASAAALFVLVDQTGGGTITYLEFLAAALDRDNIDESTLKEAFNLLDIEGRGVISVYGLCKLYGKHVNKSKLKVMIDSADLDGDGNLNFAEFKELVLDVTNSIAPNDGRINPCQPTSSSAIALNLPIVVQG